LFGAYRTTEKAMPGLSPPIKSPCLRDAGIVFCVKKADNIIKHLFIITGNRYVFCRMRRGTQHNFLARRDSLPATG
jgi:hypothetical protein